MNIVCVGISHQTAPAELRAKMQFTREEMGAVLPQVRASGISEAMLFSSADRTELTTACDEALPSSDSLIRLLTSFKGAEGAIAPKSFSVWTGTDAVEHLLRAASGLDSMIIGDTEFVTAFREGYTASQRAGAVGFLLDQVFAAAKRTHERALAETLIGEGAISVSAAVVELAERIFDDLAQRNALIMGSGETVQTTASLLRARGIGSLMTTHKSPERATHLAEAVDGCAIPFETFREHLPGIDIIIASLQSEPHILTSKTIKEVERSRHGQMLFLIDCGIPHNIDPFARELENVFLYDLDMLNMMVSQNIAQRRTHAPAVEAIVREELEALRTWFTSLGASSTVEALREAFERIRSEEVGKEVRRFNIQDQKSIEELTKRITDRIARLPGEHLNDRGERSSSDRLKEADLLRKLFGLNPEQDDGSKGD